MNDEIRRHRTGVTVRTKLASIAEIAEKDKIEEIVTNDKSKRNDKLPVNNSKIIKFC